MRSLALALLAMSGPVGAQAPPRVTLTEPCCLAYSPAEDAYACVDFALSSDDITAPGARSGRHDPFVVRDVTRWRQHGAAAWGGHQAIVLVTAAQPDTRLEPVHLVLTEREYGGTGPVRRVRSLASARREVAARGYSRAVDVRRELVAGRWQRFAGGWLRWTTREHSGGASEVAIASLDLRCEPPAGASRGRSLLGDHLRGASATAFWTTGAPSFAVTLVERGGGEETGHVETRTVRVAACVAGGARERRDDPRKVARVLAAPVRRRTEHATVGATMARRFRHSWMLVP